MQDHNDCLYVHKKELLTTEIDDDLIVMADDKAGSIMGLNPTAKKIWELLENPMKLDALIDELVAFYQVSAELCRPEIASFLEDSVKHGLVSRL